jgi:hypothetical protein
MTENAQIGSKKRELTDLRGKAARIVAMASAQGRQLTPDEDAHVLALMGRVRALEAEIHHLVKHHEQAPGNEAE